MSDSTYDPIRDPGRLAALRATGLLDSPPEPSFDRLTRLAARIIRAPVALVSLVDADRQFFKGAVGFPHPGQSGDRHRSRIRSASMSSPNENR